jgi:hypothetical protein
VIKRNLRIIFIAAALIVLFTLTAFGASTLDICVSDATAEIDSLSDEIKVDVVTTSNPGYIVGMFTVNWNSNALVLERVEYNSALAPDNGSPSITNTGSYPVSFGDDVAAKDYSGTGRLVTLVFKATNKASSGDYQIHINGKKQDFLNYKLDNVPYSTKNGTLNLKLSDSLEGQQVYSTFPFKDIAEDNPNRDAIAKVYELGIIAGTTVDTFSPDMTLSRAMIVAMLWRLEGRPEVAASSFSDVPSGKYYTTAVAWAVSNKIASGYNDGKFRPEQDVTRQELAAFLYRYAKLKGKGFQGTWMFPLNYPDVDDISSYAYEPLCWMVMNGIMKEQPSGKIAPKVRATREETAVAFAGLVEALK